MEREGFVARVAGVVVDAEFPSGDLPGIHNALRIDRDHSEPLIVEGRRLGRVKVCYSLNRAENESRKPMFLAEEASLLKTIAWQISLLVEKHLIKKRKREL